MSGTALSQVIPIVSLPIITRLYEQSDFGIYAYYLSIINLVVPMMSLRYEYSLALSKFKLESKVLLIVCIIPVLVLLIIFLFTSILISSFTDLKLNLYYYSILSIFPMSLSQILFFWYIKNNNYKIISIHKIVLSFIINALSIIFGIFGSTNYNLIFSYIIGQIIGFLFLSRNISKALFKKKYIVRRQIKKIALKYSDFPKYEAPSCLLHAAHTNIHIIVITNFADSVMSGGYFLAYRVLQAPISLFTSSFSDAFYQKMANINSYEQINYEVNKCSDSIFNKTFIIYLIITILFQSYCEIIFGNNWVNAGIYFSIVSPQLYLSLLSSPYSHLLKIIGKQNLSLKINLFRFIVTIFIYVIFIYAKINIIYILAFLVILNCILIMCTSSLIDYYTNNRSKKIQFQRYFSFLTLFINMCVNLWKYYEIFK